MCVLTHGTCTHDVRNGSPLPHMGPGDPNAVPHACPASSLPTEPCPQSLGLSPLWVFDLYVARCFSLVTTSCNHGYTAQQLLCVLTHRPGPMSSIHWAHSSWMPSGGIIWPWLLPISSSQQNAFKLPLSFGSLTAQSVLVLNTVPQDGYTSLVIHQLLKDISIASSA